MDQIANCKQLRVTFLLVNFRPSTRTGEPNADFQVIQSIRDQTSSPFSGRRSFNQQPFKRVTVTFKSPSQKGHDRRIAIGLEKVHPLPTDLMNVPCEGRDVFTVSVCLVDVSFRYGSHWMIRFSCISCLDNRRPKMEEKLLRWTSPSKKWGGINVYQPLAHHHSLQSIQTLWGLHPQDPIKLTSFIV